MENKFHLLVRSREGIIFQGDVDSISSYNDKGAFDVLAEHANFISLIKRKVIIRSGKLVKSLDVSNALMRVRENYVEVYVGIEDIAKSS